MDIWKYAVYYPFLIAALINCLIALLTPKFRLYLSIASLIIIGFFLINALYLQYFLKYDLSIFMDAGLSVQNGKNPYDDPRFASPPTALPLFVLFSMADLETANFLWTIANIFMALSAPALAWYFYRRSWATTDLSEILPLTALFVMAIPTLWGFNLGQLSLFQTVAILIAYLCKDNRNALPAGTALAIATIKPQTALPILIPFLHFRYYKVAICAAVVIAVLTFSFIPPDSLVSTLRQNWDNIWTLSRSSGINDYSSDGPFRHTIIGLNFLLHYLGLKNGMAAQVISLTLLLIAGGLLWLGWLQKWIDEGAVAALTACIALLFLYHRIYDATLLIVPVTYLYLKVRRTTGSARRLLVASFLCLLPVWVAHARGAELVVAYVSQVAPVLRYPAEALFLPFATWGILLAAALMVAELRLPERGGARQPVEGNSNAA